jgi:hypothetical protein
MLLLSYPSDRLALPWNSYKNPPRGNPEVACPICGVCGCLPNIVSPPFPARNGDRGTFEKAFKQLVKEI